MIKGHKPTNKHMKKKTEDVVMTPYFDDEDSSEAKPKHKKAHIEHVTEDFSTEPMVNLAKKVNEIIDHLNVR